MMEQLMVSLFDEVLFTRCDLLLNLIVGMVIGLHFGDK